MLALATGCDGASGTATTLTSTTGTPTTVGAAGATPTTTGAKPNDGTEFCAIFQGLSARSQTTGDGFERYPDEAAWVAGIQNVERIAATAPAAISSQAKTYVQLVQDRKDLAASYDYQPVPQNVKLQFGRAHAAMQQEANELIAFAKEHCSGVT